MNVQMGQPSACYRSRDEVMFVKAESGLPRWFRDNDQANHIRLFFGYQAEATCILPSLHWH